MTDHKEEYDAGRITTTDGRPPQSFEAPAPAPIGANGQHEQYWVLSESERAKGFVRPVRTSYRHVGIPGPKYPLRELTEDEKIRYAKYKYVQYEAYPDGASGSSAVGEFWTQDRLDKVGKGCGTVTTMGHALAETYARNPGFYGATMCVHCGKHLPVGENGEFTWGDGQRVGA